jgi:hypothetical protein
MNPEEQLKVFETYLKRRASFEKMVLAVVEAGESQSQAVIDAHRIRLDLLDDIIHDFDALVKSNLSPSNLDKVIS